ncbi:DUF1799 domain-containing protein [Rhodopseudomonas palustris]|uniref:Uncharacterized protein n=1 Tax=Rhodopseudomonas palustris TaxID=1076 RepID=A0A418V425_RHOPL|nr:DUF1799 domain-containing protein [Rhodopseudomonas palustris]RJF70866.1 hypothetical protein D4Q52_14650 [Rhodopseudomonas palustris]
MDEARALGLNDTSLAQLLDALAGACAQFEASNETDGVWPENWDTVKAFCAVATQWRVVSVGGGDAPARAVFVGLDYTAARAGLDAEAIAVTPALWAGLRVMEAEACTALNESND